MEELSNFSLNLDVSLFSFTKWTVEERERERKKMLLMKMPRPSCVSCKIKDSKEQSFIIISLVETKRKEWKGNGWNKNTEV